MLWVKCLQELDVSEFVLSNELVSMALAMVAENPDVNDILSELFTPDGNELYVHPASRYLRCAHPINLPCRPRGLCEGNLPAPPTWTITPPSLPLSRRATAGAHVYQQCAHLVSLREHSMHA